MMSEIIFIYCDGSLVKRGDLVSVANHGRATVELLLQPGTQDSIKWQCFDTGGILIKFDDGYYELCQGGFDEDFEKQA